MCEAALGDIGRKPPPFDLDITLSLVDVCSSCPPYTEWTGHDQTKTKQESGYWVGSVGSKCLVLRIMRKIQ